jgi:hypothetical protein
MAGKKPSKPIAGQGKDRGPSLPGKIYHYSGGKNYPVFTCPTCGRNLKKGFIYEDANTFFCSRVCIPVQAS